MRAIGFNLGLRGDIVMSTVATRSFKQLHPDSTLTLGVGPEFADMLPLFAQHPYFDDTHVYSTYDNWPAPADLDYLKRAQYDLVFDGFPKHRDDWFQHRHQYAEAAHMVGLPIPDDITPTLTRWFKTEQWNDTIALAAFAGYYTPNNTKRLSFEQAQALVCELVGRGYRVLQLGGADEPELENAFRLKTDYFGSVRSMLACRALIHTDTGMGHIAGAYNHPSVGLYGYAYYGEDKVHRIAPVHDRFVMVRESTVAEISVDSILHSLTMLLA